MENQELARPPVKPDEPQGLALDSAEKGSEDALLRKQSEWMRITLASIGDGVITTDADGRVTFVNGVAETLTGWSHGEAVGRLLSEVFRILDEKTRLPIDNPALRALRDGAVVGVTNHTILVARDGKERPIEDNAAPMRDGAAVPIGAVLVFRDVTERKRSEAALHESQLRYRQAAAESAHVAETNAKFRAFFEQGTNFAGVLSLDGIVIEANRLCLEACGFTREDVIGRPFWECGWWNRSDSLKELVRLGSLQAAQGQMFRTETHYFVADGSERVVDLILAPVSDESGRVLFVAATGSDVTERRRMEDSLREADRQKDAFIALLAHELRNPLVPLRNGLQIIRLAGSDAPAAERARSMMERQLAHMVRLIDDLLDVARINRNKMELRRGQVALSEVVSSALETARPLIDAEGHELTVSLPQRPIYLDADLTRLAQVFSNLLTNSAKYTERGGHIWLSAERRGDEVAVSVRDTGIGIPTESLGSIFDMFAQLDRPSVRSAGGLGIGLALVKGLVEMHGGKVTAQSSNQTGSQGTGSTFTVTLPVLGSQPPPPVDESEASGAQAAHGASRRILVVDDNRDGADSLAMLLRLLKNEVQIAHDGVEAVEMAATFRPHIILMDLGMPRLNGYDATRRIRGYAWGRDIIIIALTGWGQEGDRARSHEAGCNSHLVKPVNLPDLQKLLDEFKQPS